jgi:hypothetical protein
VSTYPFFAFSVRELKAGGELYAKPVPRFFKGIFMCFVGDGRLKAYDDASLRRLSVETNARNALLLEIKETSVNTNITT